MGKGEFLGKEMHQKGTNCGPYIKKVTFGSKWIPLHKSGFDFYSSECLLHLSGCGTFDPHEWLSVEAAAHTVVHCCPYVATQSIPPETHLFDSSSHLWRRQKLKQQQQPDYLLFVSKEVSNAENFYISGSANGGSQSASSPQTAYLWTVGWTEIGGQQSPCQRRSDRPLVRMTLLK